MKSRWSTFSGLETHRSASTGVHSVNSTASTSESYCVRPRSSTWARLLGAGSELRRQLLKAGRVDAAQSREVAAHRHSEGGEGIQQVTSIGGSRRAVDELVRGAGIELHSKLLAQTPEAAGQSQASSFKASQTV